MAVPEVNGDITQTIFTDASSFSSSTESLQVKSVHITELRNAVNKIENTYLPNVHIGSFDIDTNTCVQCKQCLTNTCIAQCNCNCGGD